MAETRSKSKAESTWWVPLIQGIALAVLGLFLVFAPGTTSYWLVTFLGIYLLILGIFSIVEIFTKTSNISWGWLLTRGILGIVAGIVVLNNAFATTVFFGLTIGFVIGLLGIMIGVLGVIGAFTGEGIWAGVVGVISIIFGFALLGSPYFGGLAIPIILGIVALIGAVYLFVLSYQQHKKEGKKAQPVT